jgi:hypothetical protein
VPETLGTGGLLLDDPSAHRVAAAVGRVLTDDAVRAALVAAGRARLETFGLARTRAVMAAVVTRWVAAGGQWAS